MQLARLFDLHTLKKEQQLLAAQSQSNSTVNQPAVTPPAAVQQLGDFAIAIFNWASGVVGGFNICLKDFSTAFADGRVFCLLVKHCSPTECPHNGLRGMQIKWQSEVCKRTTKCSRKTLVYLEK